MILIYLDNTVLVLIINILPVPPEYWISIVGIEIFVVYPYYLIAVSINLKAVQIII